MARVLTLDNMHEVRLQRLFDDHALNRWQSFIARTARKITKPKDKITLEDVYKEFAQGKKFHEVQESLNLRTQSIDQVGVLNSTILVGQIFHNAANPGINNFNRESTASALCDENLAEHNAIDGAQRVFGHASHTIFEGLNGQCDSRVWEKGLNFDYIISKDRAVKSNRITDEERDLTNCAYDAWKEVLTRNGGVIDDEVRQLPIIVHIMDHKADGREVKRLLQKNKTNILRLSQERKSPVIEIKKNRKARIGKHYLELIDGDVSEKRQSLIDARYDEFLRSDPYGLGPKTVLEYASTLRELIEVDVDKVIKERLDAEILISVLNDYIERVHKVGCLTKQSEDNFLRQIDKDKPVKMFNRRQQERRSEKGFGPNGLAA